MVNAFAVLAILALFAWYEILFAFRSLLDPRGRLSYLEFLQRRAVRGLFSILRAASGFKPLLDDRVGEALPERFVIVANHQSLIDIPVMWKLAPERFRLRFVAKRELGAGIPLVSTCLRLQGHGLIRRRGDMVQAMKGLARFTRRCLRDGSCPVIFPEGTRSRDGSLGPFHTAGFRRLQEISPLPVVVAAIEGGCHVATLGDLLGKLGKFPYRVRIAAVLPAPRGKKEILAALEESRGIIAAALEEMRRD